MGNNINKPDFESIMINNQEWFIRLLIVIITLIISNLFKGDEKIEKNYSNSSVPHGKTGGNVYFDTIKITYVDTIKKAESVAVIDSTEIIKEDANALRKKGKFKAAIERYSKLIERGKDDDLLRLRASCFEKIGEREKAVYDLKSMQYFTDEDERKYNKLNPIRKKIVGHCTLCCDGSYSPSCATGRGACSWHGGVCEWNAPIYEMRRKW